jgi:hypothetical protein
MMVASKIVFEGCWRWGLLAVLDQQGDNENKIDNITIISDIDNNRIRGGHHSENKFDNSITISMNKYNYITPRPPLLL